MVCIRCIVNIVCIVYIVYIVYTVSTVSTVYIVCIPSYLHISCSQLLDLYLSLSLIEDYMPVLPFTRMVMGVHRLDDVEVWLLLVQYVIDSLLLLMYMSVWVDEWMSV